MSGESAVGLLGGSIEDWMRDTEKSSEQTCPQILPKCVYASHQYAL